MAFVKMRDSVSFYKIDPDEYVLKNNESGWAGFYSICTWSVRLWRYPTPSGDVRNSTESESYRVQYMVIDRNK